MTKTKTNYSVWIGLAKTAKNSSVLLVPFLLAVLAGVPSDYAWLTGPVIYMLKNWYNNK
jgi:hypothetical protein